MAVGRRAGNKKPAAHRVAGRVVEGGLRFREGDDARVHRYDCVGGGRQCGSCCRDGSAHSCPQAWLLGRNVDTVFSTVNNPVGCPAGFGRGGVSDNCHPFGTPGPPCDEKKQRAKTYKRPGASTGAASRRWPNFVHGDFFATGAIPSDVRNAIPACKQAIHRCRAGRRRTAPHKPICAKSARLPGQEKTRAGRRGSDGFRQDRRRLSRRSRSVPRSRRARAVPSTGPVPLARPRRSSRRRRRPR